ncbi:hypothetical protein COB72_02300, partial [bacterium]
MKLTKNIVLAAATIAVLAPMAMAPISKPIGLAISATPRALVPTMTAGNARAASPQSPFVRLRTTPTARPLVLADISIAIFHA